MEQIKKGKFAIVFKNGTFNPGKTSRDEIPDLLCKVEILDVIQDGMFFVRFIFGEDELYQRIVNLQEMQDWLFFDTRGDCDYVWDYLVKLKYSR